MSKTPEMHQGLFEAAMAALKNAHAPYSNFPIGAAVLGDDGKIYAGCNVENASYPEGICAETSAIAAMVTAGGKQIQQICVVSAVDDVVTPCGGCRQKIRELASKNAPIFVCGPDGLKRQFSLEELLPVSFGPEQLEAK
jgi:cytidine deaminase